MTAGRAAALPMYDADPAAVQAWWGVIARCMRAEGIEQVPEKLDWPTDLDAHWRDPALLLSQTCGYPIVTDLRDVVRVIGAFRYTAPGCSGIDYRSMLVVRSGVAGRTIADFRGSVAVINGFDSHSGCHSLRGTVAPFARDGRFFSRWDVSGSHRRSLELLREGAADLAAIDCVTLAALGRQRPRLLDGLQLIGMTPAVPGLPLVTAGSAAPEQVLALRRALTSACADTASASLREALFLDGFEPVEAAAWQPVADVRARSSHLL